MSEQSPGNHQQVSPPECLLVLTVCPPPCLSACLPLSLPPLVLHLLLASRCGDEDHSKQLQREHVAGRKGEAVPAELLFIVWMGGAEGGLVTATKAGPGSRIQGLGSGKDHVAG